MAHKKAGVGKSPKAGGPNRPKRAPMKPLSRSPKAGGPNKPPPPSRRPAGDPAPSRGQQVYADTTPGKRIGQQTGTTSIPVSRWSSYDYATGQGSTGGAMRVRAASYRELQALQRKQAADKKQKNKNK